MTYILGIETSCDETAAGVVADGRRILSNVVASQVELHRPYGGVYPEVASRQHVVTITPVIRQALEVAGVDWEALDAVAVTYGPGLAGSLLVGVNAAKGLAWARGLPLVGINHLEGHVYSNWLEVEGEEAVSLPALDAAGQAFPLLLLVVSGGHTELLLMQGHGRYERLGATLDDAAGEAFDKVARLLGLSYPGGPAIQAAAAGGAPSAFDFPRGLMQPPEHVYNFSFSGLKTAVLRVVRELDEAALPVGDLAASFQEAVVDVLVEKTRRAAEAFGVARVCVCGGVAANGRLRQAMRERLPVPVRVPPLFLCTDNAAMIAAAGHCRFLAGERAGWDLDVVANLRLV
ncbi:MAG: tRNA (adenosine(37)-N6)-threonylcarbamoyltransferase complex transferase subunit TsaD [Chloroflexi bacterium]|nr:tRNA (adenosine(37)-N6)-threonylcarbamoyltransferase complex transferase subunit TsaD [Chloroflexota bacterium]